MNAPIRTKVFKSGNSGALRLPKSLDLPVGTEVEIVRKEDGVHVRVVETGSRKIDLTGIYGSIPGIRRPPCDENPRDWHPAG